MTQRVGFVGPGQLGAPMIDRLLSAGHEVTVFARRAEVAETWRARGVPTVPMVPTADTATGTADTAAELAAACDIVIVCVYDEDQLSDLVLGGGGLAAAMRPGAVVISHTTSGIAVTEELAAALRARGVEFIDAPVSGTADQIRRGELTVLLGGAEPALALIDPVLAAYCSQRLRTGAAGTATRVKLVNNLLFAANVQLAGAAVQLASALGVDERTLVESLAHCSANSAALGHVRQFGSVHALAEQVGRYLRKDVAAVQESARSAGVELGMLGRVATTGPVEELRP